MSSWNLSPYSSLMRYKLQLYDFKRKFWSTKTNESLADSWTEFSSTSEFAIILRSRVQWKYQISVLRYFSVSQISLLGKGNHNHHASLLLCNYTHTHTSAYTSTHIHHDANNSSHSQKAISLCPASPCDFQDVTKRGHLTIFSSVFLFFWSFLYLLFLRKNYAWNVKQTLFPSFSGRLINTLNILRPRALVFLPVFSIYPSLLLPMYVSVCACAYIYMYIRTHTQVHIQSIINHILYIHAYTYIYWEGNRKTLINW